MNNAQKQQAFSVAPHINNRPVSSRGVGAVQLPEGILFYKFKEAGIVRIDVVPYRSSKPQLHPYAVGDVWYEKTYFIHKNVGQDKATVICPKATFGKPCPICEYRNKLDRADDEDVKMIKELNPQERQLFNIVIPSETKDIMSPKIYVLDQARFGFGKMLDDIIKNADEDDSHYQYYVDLQKGSTLKLGIEEIRTDTFKFFGVSAIEIKQRKYTYDESLLDLTVDLDSVLQITPYETLRDMFFNTGDYSIAATIPKDDDDDDDVPAKPKQKQKPVIDDDDDDDVPVKPKKKVLSEEEENVSSKKKSKPVIDDEDDDVPVKPKKKVVVDDDDDDDDVPAKPKQKQKPPIDDDDDDVPVKPKKKVIVDDDDEDDVPVKKTVSEKRRSIVEDWDDED